MAKYEPGLSLANRSVFDANDVPVGLFLCMVKADSNYVGGNCDHSRMLTGCGTLLIVDIFVKRLAANKLSICL